MTRLPTNPIAPWRSPAGLVLAASCSAGTPAMSLTSGDRTLDDGKRGLERDELIVLDGGLERLIGRAFLRIRNVVDRFVDLLHGLKKLRRLDLWLPHLRVHPPERLVQQMQRAVQRGYVSARE